MSDIALAAAIWPKVNGSSTTGVKKSTVLTIARSSERRNTPASSPVEIPTSKSGWLGKSSRARTAERSAGPSLPAQPAALHRAVRRTRSPREGLLSLSLDIAAIVAHRSIDVSRAHDSRFVLLNYCRSTRESRKKERVGRFQPTLSSCRSCLISGLLYVQS